MHNFNEARRSQENPKLSKTNSINYETEKIPFLNRALSIDNIGIEKDANGYNLSKKEKLDIESMKKSLSDMIKRSLGLEEKELIPYLENANHFTYLETEKMIKQKKPYNHFTFINSINIKNNESFIMEKDDEANELIRAIMHYKILCQTIEKHLNDKENVLCCLKTKYMEYYENKYEEIIKNKEIYYYNCAAYSDLVEAAFEDLKEFIRVFHQSIYFFYKINYLDKKIQIEKSFFKPENLHNFLTSILLDKNIYSILYLSSMQLKENEELLLVKAMNYCYPFTPKDYDINKKYWLNEETILFLKENDKGESKKDKDSIKGPAHLSFHNEERNELIYRNEEEKQHDDQIPYFPAIVALKEIDFVQSPLHKLKVLVKVGDLIIQCIEDFYQEKDLAYIKNSVNADDFLPLFIYVIVKSKVKYFYTHIKIIDELASRNLKNTLSGYYFVTLQIAINIIENMYKDSQRQEKPSFTENIGARISEITNPKNRPSHFFWR